MNALTGSVIGTFSTGAVSSPMDATVNYATNTLYVLNGNGSVVFFNATTGAYANGTLGSSTITTGVSTSINLYYSSSANAIFYINWTSSPSSTDVRGINVSTGLSAGAFPTGWSGPNPFRMAGNQSANIFYITEFYGNQLELMNASTGAIINTFTTSSYPLVMALNTTSNILYVVNKESLPGTAPGSVTFFNASTGTYFNGTIPASTYPVGKNPLGIVLAP